jgi:hypothetical protein
LPNNNVGLTEEQLDFRHYLERLFMKAPLNAARHRNPPDSSYGVIETSEAEDSALEQNHSDFDDLEEGFTLLTLRPKKAETLAQTLADSDIWHDEEEQDEFESDIDEREYLDEEMRFGSGASEDEYGFDSDEEIISSHEEDSMTNDSRTVKAKENDKKTIPGGKESEEDWEIFPIEAAS